MKVKLTIPKEISSFKIIFNSPIPIFKDTNLKQNSLVGKAVLTNDIETKEIWADIQLTKDILQQNKEIESISPASRFDETKKAYKIILLIINFK